MLYTSSGSYTLRIGNWYVDLKGRFWFQDLGLPVSTLEDQIAGVVPRGERASD